MTQKRTYFKRIDQLNGINLSRMLEEIYGIDKNITDNLIDKKLDQKSLFVVNQVLKKTKS
jgi:hypothetical protein